MGWYRTRGGRLIHGNGGLAAVYEARGWARVPDDEAAAEVASGAAQARADIEGEAAARVDAAVLAQEQAEKAHQRPPAPQDPGSLTIEHGERPLSPEDRALVEDAIRDESPGHHG